jgi:cyclopropane-fatty-acyl-phospholipid synthase
MSPLECAATSSDVAGLAISKPDGPCAGGLLVWRNLERGEDGRQWMGTSSETWTLNNRQLSDGKIDQPLSRDDLHAADGSQQHSDNETTVAEALQPLLAYLFKSGLPLRFIFWDGSSLGPSRGVGVVRVQSADAIRRIVWAPGELGLSRAYVARDIEVEGDIFSVLRNLRDTAPQDLRNVGFGMFHQALGVARELGIIGLPPRPPREEARPRGGRRHSLARDKSAISHHYDVGNEFYRLFLGPSMTYSCARFVDKSTSLEDAQEAKHELVCRKLGLDNRPGARVLDVGCGWGSLALHAARHHGAHVVGITLSEAQMAEARRRVAKADLDGQIEIRLQDYRSMEGEQFDAISSIGMFEHVGTERAAEYFATLWGLLVPKGRLLNHAISTPGGSKIGSRSFIGRYVFPDGELVDVGQVVLGLQRAGFEVRDVESLREHYSKTLHAWVRNLEERWDEAVSAAGVGRTRVWHLYMAASANGFDDGGLGIHQVLGVKCAAGGESGMPLTRRSWH